MNLTLLFHPLSSFCQKVVIGLYELDLPFTKRVVDLSNEAERAALLRLWPIGKFPVLRDEERDRTVVESSIILEYLDELRADRPRSGAVPDHGTADGLARARLVPAGVDLARECRFRDRFFDLYVNVPVGKIVTDKLRPDARRDPFGVHQARAQLETAYGVADEWLRAGPWAVGEAFTMADCAAAPALLYAKEVLPFGDRHARLTDYFARLARRPSFARVIEEAKPYWSMFPG